MRFAPPKQSNSVLGSTHIMALSFHLVYCQVNKLIEKLEDAFIKHFADGDRSEGMKFLRPGKKKERHIITFSLGQFV